MQGSKWEYGTIGLYATEVLGWVLVLLFMIWYILRMQNVEFRMQKFSWSKDRIFILSLFLFTLYGLLSSFWAGDSQLALQHGQWVMLGTLLFLLFSIGPVKAKSALWAFVLGSVPVGVLGIWQFLSQSTFGSTLLGLTQHIVSVPGTSIIESETIGRWLRAYGSFSHPNVFGGYLVFAIASTLLLSFTVKKWKRVFLHAIVVLQSAALFFTFSRSAWIAVGIVLLFYCSIVVRNAKFWKGLWWGSRTRDLPPLALPLGKGEKRAALLGLVASIVSVFAVFSFIYFPLLQTRFAASSSHEVASITERVSGYHDAWQLFRENWFLGVGGGNYTYALMQVLPGYDVWWYQPVHVVPLLFVVEYGLVGGALLLFVSVSFFRLQTTDYRLYFILVTCYLPLLFLDHYLWSSLTGIMLLFVYTSLYFRFLRE